MSLIKIIHMKEQRSMRSEQIEVKSLTLITMSKIQNKILNNHQRYIILCGLKILLLTVIVIYIYESLILCK